MSENPLNLVVDALLKARSAAATPSEREALQRACEIAEDARQEWFASHAPEQQRWQPIETAPTDGRQILLSSPTWDGVVVRVAHEMHRDLADWIDPPTHWVVAPKPPASGAPETVAE